MNAMDNTIRVLIKAPEEETGHITRIKNTLKVLQKAAGGSIETVTISPDIVVICNEDGRSDDLLYNCDVCGISFVGTIIVAGVDGDEFADIPDYLTLDYWDDELLSP